MLTMLKKYNKEKILIMKQRSKNFLLSLHLSSEEIMMLTSSDHLENLELPLTFAMTLSILASVVVPQHESRSSRVNASSIKAGFLACLYDFATPAAFASF